jgi:hypothetical protein
MFKAVSPKQTHCVGPFHISEPDDHSITTFGSVDGLGNRAQQCVAAIVYRSNESVLSPVCSIVSWIEPFTAPHGGDRFIVWKHCAQGWKREHAWSGDVCVGDFTVKSPVSLEPL